MLREREIEKERKRDREIEKEREKDGEKEIERKTAVSVEVGKYLMHKTQPLNKPYK